MKRRKFFETTGAIGLISILPKSNSIKEATNGFEMGYQLYSIRDKMALDPIGTLKSLKAFGYTHFEIYGYDDKQNSIYGMTPNELNYRLIEMDVKVTSGHYGFSDYLQKSDDDLKRFVDRSLTCAHLLKSKYITWPWLAPDLRTLENYKLMVQKLNVIGEHMEDSGIGFAYHNHGFEFVDHDGETGYDLILKGTDPSRVKLQMDMYWVMHTSMKTTPKKLVQDNPGRFVMWHIKDMDAISRDYTELGNGSINYLNALPDPKESGLEFYYIEQGGNFAIDSLESARVSAGYCQDKLRL